MLRLFNFVEALGVEDMLAKRKPKALVNIDAERR